MSKEVMQINIVISCPSDVVEEINIIANTIDEINRQIGNHLGIVLNSAHWSKDLLFCPGNAQDIIDGQLIAPADALIAVFNRRIGSPTSHYDSGTIEEINLMIEKGCQVFVFFSDQPVKPSEIDYESLNKVNEFKKTYAKKGLYETYESNGDFASKLYNQLRLYVQQLSENSEEAPHIEKKKDGNASFVQHIENKGKVGTQYNITGNVTINHEKSHQE